MDCRKFVGEWLVTIKGDVLVGVGRFAINVKIETTIVIVNDGDIKHGNLAIFLDFFRPFDVRVDGIEVVVQGLDVVVVDGDNSIVGFPKPKQDDITGTDVVIASGVVGKGSLLKSLHINVGKWAAGGFAHAKTFELFVKIAPPTKIG